MIQSYDTHANDLNIGEMLKAKFETFQHGEYFYFILYDHILGDGSALNAAIRIMKVNMNV